MSKALFQSIEQQDWRQLANQLQNPDAVRALHNLPQSPSKILGRTVVSPLEWAMLRREPKAVECLLKAADLRDHGRQPEQILPLILEIFEDDFQEVHWPDRDRHSTVREAMAPPRGHTPAEVLKQTAQIIMLLDKAGLDWNRPVRGRPAWMHLDVHTSSPAYAFIRSIVERHQALMQKPNRVRAGSAPR